MQENKIPKSKLVMKTRSSEECGTARPRSGEGEGRCDGHISWRGGMARQRLVRKRGFATTGSSREKGAVRPRYGIATTRSSREKVWQHSDLPRKRSTIMRRYGKVRSRGGADEDLGEWEGASMRP
ncbi:hypothetical protein L484_013379 [Morus notabilis]|uniref:Uncharacterized protein n=1 Tax=Morus notabilis TaxID=981085 RepID=W9QYZ1_9ROSA|nr:hypothetical protein L484_013379 [Morus notabilis]